MALLVDEKTRKELNDRLEEFTKYGMILNYMYDLNRIKEDDLEKMFFSKDLELATLSYFKIIKNIDDKDEVNAFNKYCDEANISEDLDRQSSLNILNKYCIKNIINRLSDIKNIDKTFVNTYNYLLGK